MGSQSSDLLTETLRCLGSISIIPTVPGTDLIVSITKRLVGSANSRSTISPPFTLSLRLDRVSVTTSLPDAKIVILSARYSASLTSFVATITVEPLSQFFYLIPHQAFSIQVYHCGWLIEQSKLRITYKQFRNFKPFCLTSRQVHEFLIP